MTMSSPAPSPRSAKDHPDATIHINTNGSRPKVLQGLIDAGCNSVRISAISFTDPVFRAYYRPVGYTIEDVIECGRVMSRSGGQVCLNLLTFPGLTDSSAELDRTPPRWGRWAPNQIQWRSLNCDHDWLVDVLAARGLLPEDGIGLAAAYQHLVDRLPGVTHGNFTRPVVDGPGLSSAPRPVRAAATPGQQLVAKEAACWRNSAACPIDGAKDWR